MENLDTYAELEYQRRHLVEQKTPEDREMVMSGINRLLDSILDIEAIPLFLPSSVEGQTHLDTHLDRGCE